MKFVDTKNTLRHTHNSNFRRHLNQKGERDY